MKMTLELDPHEVRRLAQLDYAEAGEDDLEHLLGLARSIEAQLDRIPTDLDKWSNDWLRTSRRIVDNTGHGESLTLIATFTISPDMWAVLGTRDPQRDHEPNSAERALHSAAEVSPAGGGWPGQWFANTPRIIMGERLRVAVTQWGGLNV